MALMMGKHHEALLAAGADRDAAREAAEEVANYENRIARMEGDLVLLTWMVGAILALEIMQFARIFMP